MSLSDKLNDLTSAPSSPFARRERPGYPTGWEPGMREDGKGGMTVTTPLIPQIMDEGQWNEAVASMGIEVPEGWIVRLYEARYDPAAWHRDEKGDEAVTRPVWRYRFKGEPALTSSVSYDDMIERIGQHTPRDTSGDVVPTFDGKFLIATGDWQLGKVDGDGVQGTVDRILVATDNVCHRIAELKRLGRWPGSAVIILTGDCVEGFVSQNGANTWRTVLTMTEQVRLYRRLVEHLVTEVAKVSEELLVITVPGNHGETVRLSGKMATRLDDSWDVEAVVAVADALSHNPEAYGHVKFVTPEKDQGTIVLDLAGTITAMAHGHLIPRGDVGRWVAEHAKNMAPVGDAHLIITGHRHHLRLETMGPRTWIQVPAMESESTWWKERTGDVSPPGMVTLVAGAGTWTDLLII